MTVPGLVIPLTPADIAQHRAWDEAVKLSLAKPLGLAEMVDRLFASAYQLNASSRAWGPPYDSRIVRDYVVLQKAARFFQDHPDEVAAMLRGSAPAPKRARRA